MSAATQKPVVYNIPQWIEENKQDFLPPVCNKMMHGDGQMKAFFIGGPNQRKDFHLECGEELFYMVKGDMVLKIVERGSHKDIPIKQGELFLLPACVQHSPQRQADTIGWVVERDRHPDTEKDALRYFVEKEGVMTTESLYEKWFYCADLGTQIGPIIREYFASEQHATGKPLPGTILENPPVIPDPDIVSEAPINFSQWMKDREQELDTTGKVQMYDGGKYQTQVFVYGKGENSDCATTAETWILQIEGKSSVSIEGDKIDLVKDDGVLVPQAKRFTVSQDSGSRSLVVYQDPTKADTWPGN